MLDLALSAQSWGAHMLSTITKLKQMQCFYYSCFLLFMYLPFYQKNTSMTVYRSNCNMPCRHRWGAHAHLCSYLTFGPDMDAQWTPCPKYASIGGAILDSYLRCNIIYLQLQFRPTSFWTSLPQNCHSFILLPNYMKMQWEILNGPDSTHINQRVIPILNTIPPWDAKTTDTTVTINSTGNGDQDRTKYKVIS